jgi:hypothetical protein
MAKVKKEQPTGRGAPRSAAVSSPYSTSTIKTNSSKRTSPRKDAAYTVPKFKGRPPKPGSDAWKRQQREAKEMRENAKKGILPPPKSKKEEVEPVVDDDEELTDLEDEEEQPEVAKVEKGKEKEENENCPVCNCGQKEGAEGVWVECEQYVDLLFTSASSIQGER